MRIQRSQRGGSAGQPTTPDFSFVQQGDVAEGTQKLHLFLEIKPSVAKGLVSQAHNILEIGGFARATALPIHRLQLLQASLVVSRHRETLDLRHVLTLW